MGRTWLPWRQKSRSTGTGPSQGGRLRCPGSPSSITSSRCRGGVGRTCTARSTGTRSRRPASISRSTGQVQYPSSVPLRAPARHTAARATGATASTARALPPSRSSLHAAGVFALEAGRLELLRFALERHAFGEVSDDPRVGACWDADRLRICPGSALRGRPRPAVDGPRHAGRTLCNWPQPGAPSRSPGRRSWSAWPADALQLSRR